MRNKASALYFAGKNKKYKSVQDKLRFVTCLQNIDEDFFSDNIVTIANTNSTDYQFYYTLLGRLCGWSWERSHEFLKKMNVPLEIRREELKYKIEEFKVKQVEQVNKLKIKQKEKLKEIKGDWVENIKGLEDFFNKL